MRSGIFAITTTLALLSTGTNAQAFTPPPPFHVFRNVESATLIVRGDLNDTDSLTVAEVLAGSSGGQALLQLYKNDLWSWSAHLRKHVGSAPRAEVVAFCRPGAPGDPSFHAEVAAFSGDDVWLAEEDGLGKLLTKSTTYTRTTFLAAVKAAIQGVAERNAILATPRTLSRTRQLIAWIKTQGACWGVAHSPPGRAFAAPLGDLSAGLENPSPDEIREVVQALERAVAPREQAALLDLIEQLRVGRTAFATVQQFLARKYDPTVRRTAIRVLAVSDPSRAADQFRTFLNVDDPEVDHFFAMSPTNGCDAQMLQIVMRLIRGWRTASVRGGSPVSPWQSVSFNAFLRRHPHPKIVTLCYEWGMGDADASQGFQTLLAVTGHTMNRDRLEGWWQTAGPLLRSDYDLRRPESQQRWMTAWHKADVITRRMLVQHWLFEDQIDEAELLRAANHEPAREVMADLWSVDRLSASSRKTLIERFLTLHLAEHPPTAVARDTRTTPGLAVWAETSFRFPSVTVDFDGEIVTSDRPTMATRQSAVLVNLSQCDRSLIMPYVGDYLRGAEARARLSLREFDRFGRIVWTAEWNLGPLELRKPD